MLENQNAAIIARMIAAYEQVALCERWISLDETRREHDRQRSQVLAETATLRMLELDKELSSGHP